MRIYFHTFVKRSCVFAYFFYQDSKPEAKWQEIPGKKILTSTCSGLSLTIPKPSSFAKEQNNSRCILSVLHLSSELNLSMLYSVITFQFRLIIVSWNFVVLETLVINDNYFDNLNTFWNFKMWFFKQNWFLTAIIRMDLIKCWVSHVLSLRQSLSFD